MISLFNTPNVRHKKQGPQKPRQKTIQQYFGITAAAVGVALFASLWGIWATLSAQESIEATKVGTEPTLTAKGDIKAGSILDESMVEIKDVPATFRARGALNEVGGLIGKQVMTDLSQGTQITETSIAGSTSSTNLAGAIAPDKVAVTIAVDAESGLSGLIRQNNFVRVVALENDTQGGAYLATTCDQARVVSLGSKLSGSEEAYASVTLEVTSEEADAVRSAQFTGTISLVLLPTVSSEA